MRTLATGFEPFGGPDVNASELLVRALEQSVPSLAPETLERAACVVLAAATAAA